LFPSVLLVPIRSLACVLLPRLSFTRHSTTFTSPLELDEKYFELNCLRIFPESRYIASVPTAQKTPILLLKRVYLVIAQQRSRREFTVACVTQQRAPNTLSSKTQFYCCVPLEVSVAYQFLLWANTPHCPRGLCLQDLWSVSPFFLLFGFFRGDQSPTATSAPSLRPIRLERFPDKFSVSRVYHSHPMLSFVLSHTTVEAVIHGVAGPPIYPAHTPCKISFFFFVLEGVDPSTRSIPSFFVIRWEFGLFVSQTSL
jgi:hypothetical protein